MVTPGIAGGITMLIANALWVAFSLPPRWTSLVLSFLLGLLAVVATKIPLWQRAVAFKVLRRELPAVPGSERLLCEGRVPAPLPHPHLLRCCESCPAGDLNYAQRPPVQGESPRRPLERETQLPIDEPVRLAGGV